MLEGGDEEDMARRRKPPTVVAAARAALAVNGTPEFIMVWRIAWSEAGYSGQGFQ